MSGLFASISPRTAGMNSVDLAMMSQPSKMLTCFFMFIGGNSGSTAGGIKTTTLVIMTVYVFSHIFGISGVHIGKRRISEENVNQASLVLWLNILLVSLATLVISATQHVDIGNLMMVVFLSYGYRRSFYRINQGTGTCISGSYYIVDVYRTNRNRNICSII